MPVSVPRLQRRLTNAYIDLYPAEAAQQLEPVSPDRIARLLEDLTPARAVALLERMSPALAADSVRPMDDDAARRMLSAAAVTRVAAVLSHLDPDDRDRRLAQLEAGPARELRDLMTYPADTAGHIMDPRVHSFPANMTVKGLLLRLHTLRRYQIHTLYVVDDEGRLTGALPLSDVILAPSEQKLQDMATAPPVSVQATAPRDEVVEALSGYRLNSLPVVDFDGCLVGAIRREALIHAVQEEVTAGIQTMVGVGRDERALSSPFFAIRKRLPWLNINLLTAFLAAAVVGIFEDTIARFTALAVLLPVVAGQSGNTGAQALAVTMRGLALREVRIRHWTRIMLKEAVVGAVNGLAIAVVTVVGVYIWSGSAGLCFVIGVAMVMSMVIAGISGTAIPMLLTVVRQDPAQSSSIVLTTVTDVVGFLSFLGLATLLAGIL